ncbi:MAG: hypothetical protein HYR70_04210 [Chloroflexi bacterium]|nr:hypothetical protein [Chloroflexota bacterium]MBI3340760.1 hypothetical protein [Chloroflexota bacterium]
MKIIFKLFAALSKAVLALLIVAILAPIAYFAWRAGQPLPQPEFKGLTYYQLVEWQQIACEKKFQESRPEITSTGCFWRPVAANAAAVFPPLILILIEKRDAFKLITISNFLPATWDITEYMLWFFATQTEVGKAVLASFGGVPTPAQLEAMKQNRQQAVTNP